MTALTDSVSKVRGKYNVVNPRQVHWSRHELFDRKTRNVVAFGSKATLLAFIQKWPAERIPDLILGRQDRKGEYQVVEDYQAAEWCRCGLAFPSRRALSAHRGHNPTCDPQDRAAAIRDNQRRYNRKEAVRQRKAGYGMAHKAVATALLEGRIVKEPCAVCGDDYLIVAHHHAGYSRENWLNVTWLCRRHHAEAHRAAA